MSFLLISWITGDVITRAHIGTTWTLRRYLLLGTSTETKSWLLRYHGEAPSSEVMFTFIQWSLEHPKRAIELTNTFSQSESSELTKRLVWAAIDSDTATQIKEVFGTASSPLLRQAADELR